MAKAGARYQVDTGNIWGYAHRGDLTGVKAALQRGVDVNLPNTAGWTSLHAAAAAGHTKVISCLLRADADLSVRDRGGNTPLTEACRNGHATAVGLLVRAGAQLENVRLSQTKGAAVRAMVAEACRNADRDAGDDTEPLVGYARVQQKSNAFYGPRRTPISGKLKKRLLREKRERKRTGIPGHLGNDLAAELKSEAQATDDDDDDDCVAAGTAVKETSEAVADMASTSYAETVRQVKQASKLSRGARRARARQNVAATACQSTAQCSNPVDSTAVREEGLQPSVATESDSANPSSSEPEPQVERLQASVDDREDGHGVDNAAMQRPISRTALKKARRQRRKAAAADKTSG